MTYLRCTSLFRRSTNVFKCSTLRKLCTTAQYSHYISTKNFQEIRDENNSKLDLSTFSLDRIRNFLIIAHVDHGKSTLADRILEVTGAIRKEESNKQVLDKLQVEKERGITVKAQSASIVYNYNNKEYLLNLIDTPGHVDFSYEVARSLSASQGVILLVDANEGIQAQTVANFYLAFTSELAIVPVLNKIDLKNAQPEYVAEQMKNIFDIDSSHILKISAKYGTGVTDVLNAVVERIPSPAIICNREAPLRALLFDSWYEKYKGAICQIFVVDGVLNKGDSIQSFHTGKTYEVKEVAYLSPEVTYIEKLFAGQVGIISANIRNISEAVVGDTFFSKGENVKPLPGFREPKPMVFAGIYPIDTNDQATLKTAIEKLALNDSSVRISLESSQALGQGWRVGFLGLLHMDIFNTRLEQEHGAEVVTTTPSVPYKIKIIRNVSAQKVKKKKAKTPEEPEEFIVNNPAHWPDEATQMETYEPMVKATIITPENYLPNILPICEDRRGEQLDMKQLDKNRVVLTYKFPLNEIVIDFFDELKSVTSGYGTFDYEDIGYELSDLVKVGVKLNGNLVEELSFIVHKHKAQIVGRKICLKLAETLPRQLFQIAIQAVIGSKIVARENVKALKKDVLAKCYGGDVTRKMKLLKRQAEGKKRMKMIGNIEIPRNTFIDVLKK